MLTVLTACGPSQTDPKLEDANRLHLEALAISDSLESLISQSEGTRWDSLRQLHEAWEASLVEVPGFEHDHDHDHGHDHDHAHDHGDNTLSELPPAEMLQLQQALRDEVASMLSQAKTWDQTEVVPDTIAP